MTSRAVWGDAVTDPTPPLDEYLSVLPDRVVTRVNELITTVLDVAGALGVAVGIGWLIWGAPWRQPAAVIITGALIFGLSYVAQRRALPKPLPEVEQEIPEPLPGAAHPGTLHVLGR